MIGLVNIDSDTRAYNILMFRKCKIERQVNLLFGGNGAGKTTFIDYLKECTNNRRLNKNIQLMDGYESFTLYAFSNSGNNYKKVGSAKSKLGDSTDPGMIVKKYNASRLSEGQSIIYSIEDFLWFLENQLPYKEKESNVITIDEMDSGLSVDNIEYVMTRLNNLARARDDVQMFISFNNYATCEYNRADVLSMYTGKYVEINGYKQFRRYITMNRDRLLKKRKNNQFTGEILG